jgi:hypothetical protein
MLLSRLHPAYDREAGRSQKRQLIRAPAMMRRLVFALVALSPLAGCGTSGPSGSSDTPSPDQANLALACEVARCECRPPTSALSFTTVRPDPVQWRPDGTAYCREGYQLSRVQP